MAVVPLWVLHESADSNDTDFEDDLKEATRHSLVFHSARDVRERELRVYTLYIYESSYSTVQYSIVVQFHQSDYSLRGLQIP